MFLERVLFELPGLAVLQMPPAVTEIASPTGTRLRLSSSFLLAAENCSSGSWDSFDILEAAVSNVFRRQSRV